MGSINDLNLRDEPAEAWPDALPEQGASFSPPPKPGGYYLQLPATLPNCWDLFDTVPDKSKPGEVKQRLRLSFDKQNPCIIRMAFDGGDPGVVEQAYTTNISNVPRNRGKEKIPVSDMHYLLTVSLGYQGKPPTGNRDWINALNQYAGATVPVKLGLQGQCNPEREIYVQNQNGENVKVEGSRGCGKRHYTNDFRSADGSFLDRIYCKKCGSTTGALIRGFSNVDEFLPKPGA